MVCQPIADTYTDTHANFTVQGYVNWKSLEHPGTVLKTHCMKRTYDYIKTCSKRTSFKADTFLERIGFSAQRYHFAGLSNTNLNYRMQIALLVLKVSSLDRLHFDSFSVLLEFDVFRDPIILRMYIDHPQIIRFLEKSDS